MTIDQIQRNLAAAADDGLAPAPQVSGAEVYRAGLRRRRMRRWLSGTAMAAVAVAVAGGTTAVVRTESQPPPISPGSVRETTPAPAPERTPAPSPTAVAIPAGRTCQELANDVSAAIRKALPSGITWSKPDLPPDSVGAPCDQGGILWVTFTLKGETGRLGFEGGTGFVEHGCDAARRPARCDRFPGGEVGHLISPDEHAVLYSRDDGVYFFLGITDGRKPSLLNTEELEKAAKRIAADVFP